MPYADPEKKRQNAILWRGLNRDLCKASARGRYVRDREKRLAYSRKHYSDNAERERLRSRRRRTEKPELVAQSRRKYDLKAKYGLTEVEFEKMLLSQDGRCANPSCGVTAPGGSGSRWKIDHDHKTGKVRGLLCHLCNVMIGCARDNPEILHGAILYLESQRTSCGPTGEGLAFQRGRRCPAVPGDSVGPGGSNAPSN